MFKVILALAKKDLLLLIRDRAGFFFTCVFPLVYAIFFGSIFSGSSGGSGIGIYLVDEDRQPQAAEFISALEAAPELRVERTGREEAVEGVRKGTRSAYVLLPSGFSEANLFAGTASRVELGADPSRAASTGMLVGVLTKYAAELLNQNYFQPGKSEEKIASSLKTIDQAPIPVDQKSALQAFLGSLSVLMTTVDSSAGAAGGSGFGGFQPLEIEKVEVAVQRSGPRNPYDISFPQGVIWAVLGCAAAFGISIVIEKSHGTLVRLRMAPIGQVQILAGKAGACFVAILGVSTLLFAIAMIVFGVRPHSLLLLAAALASTATCFVGIMMLLSVLGRTERAAGGIAWSCLLIMAMLGGAMVPLVVMPEWMQTVSNVSPVKWSVLAMEGAIWRGFTPQEMLLPCAVLVTVGTLAFVVGTRAFSWAAQSS